MWQAPLAQQYRVMATTTPPNARSFTSTSTDRDRDRDPAPVAHDLTSAAVAMVLVIGAMGAGAAFITWLGMNIADSFFG